ncbi:hypothetical protein APTSU1_000996500 [Apodemus speciosus]|uniref:Uncharacterized protein n=1 Tax=Apodemus speciosus TaxID=105296 RepID=A0ABQ0F624_APOSI
MQGCICEDRQWSRQETTTASPRQTILAEHSESNSLPFLKDSAGWPCSENGSADRHMPPSITTWV